MREPPEEFMTLTDKEHLESFRSRETTLILLSLIVIAALLLVHAIFLSFLGSPSKLLVLALAIRFLLLFAELSWLQKLRQPLNPATAKRYTHYSILANIAFAFLSSYLGGAADNHYWVLMTLPVIAAASRLRLAATLSVVATAIALTFLEVWLYFRRHPPVEISEYFEAATVSLIFLVVALVVWLLVRNLRQEESKLRESLVELQLIQNRLVAEEKLAAIGRLSSAIAHEIRNPVAMISSSLTTGKQSRDPAVREEMFGIAVQEAVRLERLTTDFLSYARGKEPDRKRVNLSSTLNYVASLGKAQTGESGVTIKVECPQELEAFFDDFQIQQALLNLVLNAVEASPSGGFVLLGGEKKSDGPLVLYVENFGERISDEAASHIFEPFFSTKKKGTGLGLAIVRNIALAHRGTINLAANNDGLVRFEIRIPDVERYGGGNGTHSDRG